MRNQIHQLVIKIENLKSSESSFKSDQSVDSQEENKEEVGEIEECNQPPSYHNKISQKEIRSINLQILKQEYQKKDS